VETREELLKLREEVLNTQSARSDLLKYKLLAVGGIGAAGLGLAGSEATGNVDLVLAAVPLVCLYIDLLCRHLSLRILVTGAFMRTLDNEDQFGAYERYVKGVRSVFALEDWAVTWSTLVLSGGVLGYGIGAWFDDKPWWFYVTLIVSSVVGIVFTLIAEFHIYRRKVRSLDTGAATSQPSRLASAVMLILAAALLMARASRK
jgi:hypothetical protein